MLTYREQQSTYKDTRKKQTNIKNSVNTQDGRINQMWLILILWIDEGTWLAVINTYKSDL